MRLCSIPFACRALAVLLSAALLATPSAAQVNLPALGDSVSEDVSISAEKRLGDQVMRQIRLDPDYLDDPLLLEYVESLWNPLVQAARQLGQIGDDTVDRFAWEIFLVRDRSVNAFALPGGFVGVHLGLIAMTGARDELASVLAHELSHITQRHIARRIVGDSRSSTLAMVGMVLGLIAAARTNSADMANAAIVGGQAAATQMSLNFSRDMEREADRVGFNVLMQAGFAGSGMMSMFERMEQAYHLMDSGSYPYLRSHPLTTERIGEARARLGTGGWERPLSRAEHVLMGSRARVLMDGRAESLAKLQDLDAGVRSAHSGQEALDQLGARYASALASLKLRQWPRAENALRQAELMLQLIGPDERARRALLLLRAELAQASGQAAQGWAALEPLRKDNSRVLLLMRGQMALAGGDSPSLRSAAEALQTHLSLEPRDAGAWSLQAQLWERLDQPLRAVRALGEARAAAGDLNGAIDRMRSGLNLSRGRDADQVEAAVIDARLRSLLYERRQLLAEMYPRGAPPGTELPRLQGQALSPRLGLN